MNTHLHQESMALASNLIRTLEHLVSIHARPVSNPKNKLRLVGNPKFKALDRAFNSLITTLQFSYKVFENLPESHNSLEFHDYSEVYEEQIKLCKDIVKGIDNLVDSIIKSTETPQTLLGLDLIMECIWSCTRTQLDRMRRVLGTVDLIFKSESKIGKSIFSRTGVQRGKLSPRLISFYLQEPFEFEDFNDYSNFKTKAIFTISYDIFEKFIAHVDSHKPDRPKAKLYADIVKNMERGQLHKSSKTAATLWMTPDFVNIVVPFEEISDPLKDKAFAFDSALLILKEVIQYKLDEKGPKTTIVVDDVEYLVYKKELVSFLEKVNIS